MMPSLYALDMSENRIDTSIVSFAWDTSLEDAEAIAGDFSDFELFLLVPTGAATWEEDNETRGTEALALLNFAGGVQSDRDQQQPAWNHCGGGTQGCCARDARRRCRYRCTQWQRIHEWL